VRAPEWSARRRPHHRRLHHLPRHGYQYRLADGCAPPPFTERLATYRLRLRDGIIDVDPNPLPPGTPAAIRIS